MVFGRDLRQCGSVTLGSCSLEAVLPVLFKCCGSTVGQGPPGVSAAKVSRSRGFTHGHLRFLLRRKYIHSVTNDANAMRNLARHSVVISKLNTFTDKYSV